MIGRLIAPLMQGLGDGRPRRASQEVSRLLLEAGEVTMAVYDALGRRVATLAEGPQVAGRHQIQ